VRQAFQKAAPFNDPARAEKVALSLVFLIDLTFFGCNKQAQAFVDSEWASYNKELDTFIASSGGPFLTGSHVSAADVLFYAGLYVWRESIGAKVKLSDPLQKLFHAFESIPGVAAFLIDAARNPAVKK
jgi:glutathione S-transferase